ncbi:MAG TPA: 4Fe-4S binding protein [Geobacteraceae bacterium]|nr:4Fe-4S binding protein [Geobacteraceae bacterium]
MHADDFPPRVNQDRCTGCGRCVATCPARIFTLEPSGYRKNAVMTAPERCTHCMRCAEECPVGAVQGSID